MRPYRKVLGKRGHSSGVGFQDVIFVFEARARPPKWFIGFRGPGALHSSRDARGPATARFDDSSRSTGPESAAPGAKRGSGKRTRHSRSSVAITKCACQSIAGVAKRVRDEHRQGLALK